MSARSHDRDAHLREDELAGLAMLDEADPERARAESHARACPDCRDALASAATTLAALDALADPPPPAPEALLRARDAVHALLPAPRPRGPIGLVAALLVVSFAVPLAALPNVEELPWLLTIAVLGVAIVRTAIALAQDTRRDSAAALAFSVGIAILLAVLDADGDHGGHGVNCALLEVGTALLPAGGALALVTARRMHVSPLSMAAVAATGALAGQLAIHALCLDRRLEHLLPWHAGAVVASALVGGIVQQWVGARTGRARA